MLTMVQMQCWVNLYLGPNQGSGTTSFFWWFYSAGPHGHRGKNEQFYLGMFLMKQGMKLFILLNQICILFDPESEGMELCKENLMLHTEGWRLPRRNMLVWFCELGAVAVFAEDCFYLKEWLTNSGHSDLDIWQTFSEKRTKWTCLTVSLRAF